MKEADGTTVGVCAKPFCYSGKLLVSLKDDRKNVVVKIAQVKSLSHPGPWLADTREDGQVFEHDKTSKLKGIGAKSEEKLSKHGITTVKALRDISPEKSKEISDAAREV
jgi:predicted flap endonuclease-1-like 5' DNA nuclease